MANNFIGMCYAVVSDEGYNTDEMTTEQVVEKFYEITDNGTSKVDRKLTNSNSNGKIKNETKQEISKKILSQDFNKTPKTYSEIKAIHKLFNKSDEELSTQVENNLNYFGQQGEQAELLKSVLSEIGYLGEPTIIPKDVFEEYKSKGATVMYRGVNALQDADADLKNNQDVFIGRGTNAHGIHFSQIIDTAKKYKESGSMAEAILHPKSKIVDIIELNRLDNEDRMDIITGNIPTGMQALDKNKLNIFFKNRKDPSRFSIKAAMLGYDAINTGNGTFVVLNRKSLIMKGD